MTPRLPDDLPSYSPLHEKHDPEAGLAAPAQPSSTSSRTKWLVGLGLASILALDAGSKFGPGLVQGGLKKMGCHHSHDDSGYLEGLIADGFTVAPAYTSAPPLIVPHPAIQQATEHLANVQAIPGFPIPPKVAEGIYLSVPDEQSCMEASRRYTATEHRAGSGFDQLSALRLKEEYEKLFGVPTTGPFENVFDAGSAESQSMVKDKHVEPQVWVDTYFPVMNTPVDREISILLPNSSFPSWSAKLREDIVEGDPFSELRDEVPVFHGLSKSGNVTAEIVYAAYGRKADFEALEEAGVDVKGKIALVKYGGVFRGLKVKAAEEAGAIACLIYSDPADDGPIREENGYLAYPDGPARNPSSVQRGSVQYLSSYPGDPTTPGEPAYKNSTRLEGGNIPGIPSLPLSYEDAIPLLQLLEKRGKTASDMGSGWEGGIKGVKYWTGPSKIEVRVRNEVSTRVMPIWNTMAKIPGHIPDEAVMIGNHRDAWVLGASDPSSGTAVTNEVYRGLGALLAKGWKPLRTIYIASWDAEEYGLIGSTEWAEDFASWIPENLVSYLNIDSAGAGTKYGANASPSLAGLMKAASEEIQHPSDPTRSAFSASADGGEWSDYPLASPEYSTDEFEEKFASSTGIPSLGSGSDYTAFLQHLGVASSDGPGFHSSPEDAVYHYHSIYDNQHWMEKYGDPGFTRHVISAKVLGLVLLRLSDTLVIPLNITQYSTELSDYADKVAHIHSAMHFKTDLHLSNLTAAISTLQQATFALDGQTEQALRKLNKLTHPGKGKLPFPLPGKWKKIRAVLEEIRGINDKIKRFEKGFLGDGLKDREWYKHVGTAPGKWLGYGATTFPSITEALTLDKDVHAANVEAEKVAVLIQAMADRLQ